MNQTIDWINTIIQELVSSKSKLKDTLLKVQVLAFKLKNDKLKEWVELEINGFSNKPVPTYRQITCEVYGNLIQDLRFGAYRTRNHQLLAVEYLEKELRERLSNVNVGGSVSDLELMIEKSEQYAYNLPHLIYNNFNKLMGNGWVVDSAWQEIGSNNIEGILNSIRSQLLTFVLELAEEIGENDNINILEHKSNIDKIFDKTIGNLNGETINISIGSDNIQTITSGTISNLNIAPGSGNTQIINPEVSKEVLEVINQLKNQLTELITTESDKLDIESEIARIETQLNSENPKRHLVNGGLRIIRDILTNVAGNMVTNPVVEKINWLLGQFNN